MVDFQERDTTRGIGSEDGDESESDEEEAEPENEAESAKSEAGGETETTTDEQAEEPATESDETGAQQQESGMAAITERSATSGTQTESANTQTPGATIKADEQEDAADDGHKGGHEDDHDHHAHGDDHAGGHDHHAHDIETVRAAVVTVSSTRSIDTDSAGDAIQSALEGEGAEIATRDLVRDDFDNVQAAIDALVGRSDVDVVITTGGTGVSPDDVTVEAVRPLFEKELPGFGELFRRLSYEEIGTKVVGSRATAGIADGVPVFCLPGSENAARLGAEEIIVEQASHLAGLAQRES